MNVTETAAFNWLLNRGYSPDQITYQYASSPDFVTADGRGWEVKAPTGRVVMFGARQIADLRAFGPTTVLLWEAGHDRPFVQADFASLVIPGEWCGFLLRATWQPARFTLQTLKTPEAVEMIVSRYFAQNLRRKALPFLDSNGRRVTWLGATSAA